ncbi:PhzF family phenazine biosynthesis protein [Cognatitamlana onchidii]|uniref:PhzF family phenazine biosynthesis protein n=1 Tax=Cognatitamlana onchidii TaxID=2562860 RepID=UPI0010A6B037|nr:PhzF family phenazine biosynthesis protein [Algibacter onchidii]
MRLFTVDSFTDRPFEGNPAAVCVLDKSLPDGKCLAIAQEMNLSETAFVYKEDNVYHLKWFTPEVEVDLCGHATLATAKVLFDIYHVEEEVLNFNTKSGVLAVKKVEEYFEMNFPLGDLSAVLDGDVLLNEALGATPLEVFENGDWCLVRFEDETQVKDLEPNFSKLLEHSYKKFIVTAKSNNNSYHFISRFFAPALGINEDPVTG